MQCREDVFARVAVAKVAERGCLANPDGRLHWLVAGIAKIERDRIQAPFRDDDRLGDLGLQRDRFAPGVLFEVAAKDLRLDVAEAVDLPGLVRGWIHLEPEDRLARGRDLDARLAHEVVRISVPDLGQVCATPDDALLDVVEQRGVACDLAWRLVPRGGPGGGGPDALADHRTRLHDAGRCVGDVRLADVPSRQEEVAHRARIERLERDAVPVWQGRLGAGRFRGVDAIDGVQVDRPATEGDDVRGNVVDAIGDVRFGEDAVSLEAAAFALAWQVPDPVDGPCRRAFADAGHGAVVLDVVPDPEDRCLQFPADRVVISDGIAARAPFNPPVAAVELLVAPVWKRLLVGERRRPRRGRERDGAAHVASREHDCGAEHELIFLVRRPGFVELGGRFPAVPVRSAGLEGDEPVAGGVDEDIAADVEDRLGSLLDGRDAGDARRVAVAVVGRCCYADHAGIQEQRDARLGADRFLEHNIPHRVVVAVDLAGTVCAGAGLEEELLDDPGFPRVPVIPVLGRP